LLSLTSHSGHVRRNISGEVMAIRPKIKHPDLPKTVRRASIPEVHVIRFRSRAGYESFMIEPDRLGYRDRVGDAAPNTRVLEVREL
jgi:hypothetical protein